jgi:hypothetical protein
MQYFYDFEIDDIKQAISQVITNPQYLASSWAQSSITGRFILEATPSRVKATLDHEFPSADSLQKSQAMSWFRSQVLIESKRTSNAIDEDILFLWNRPEFDPTFLRNHQAKDPPHPPNVKGVAAPPGDGYFIEVFEAIEEHFTFNLYEGYKCEGIKQGTGRYTWADGHVTVGEWINGQCSTFEEELQRRTINVSMTATRSTKKMVQKPQSALTPGGIKKMSSNDISLLATQRAGIVRADTADCLRAVSKLELSGRTFKNDWQLSTLSQTFANSVYFQAQKAHRDEVINALVAMRAEAESAAKKKKTVMKDYCVACKTQCTFTFQCLNCTTGYCERCEGANKKHGFQKRRPPCKCVINENGRAVAIRIVDVNEMDTFLTERHLLQRST